MCMLGDLQETDHPLIQSHPMFPKFSPDRSFVFWFTIACLSVVCLQTDSYLVLFPSLSLSLCVVMSL